MIDFRKSLFILSSAIAFFLLSGSSCETDDPEPQPKPEPFWEFITVENIDQELNDVYFADKFRGWIVGDSGQLLSTTDAGENWNISYIAEENLNSFLSIGDTIFWIVGDNGLILHSEDAAGSWQKKGSPVNADFNGIYFYGNKGWIVGEDDLNGIIINTINNGQSWNWQIPPENTKGLNDVYFLSPQRGFAIGDFGWLLKTTDGGNTWKGVASGSKSSLNGITFTYDTLGYIFGDFGDYLRSFNRGESWSLQYPTFWEDLKDIQFVTPNYGWVVGHSSASYRTTDGGLNWQYQGTSEENVRINAAYFLTEVHGWAVGTDRFGNPIIMKPVK